jgi:hypothetical protein
LYQVVSGRIRPYQAVSGSIRIGISTVSATYQVRIRSVSATYQQRTMPQQKQNKATSWRNSKAKAMLKKMIEDKLITEDTNADDLLV